MDKLECFYRIGIFEYDWGYDWTDCLDEYDVKEAKYFADENNCAGNHISFKSVLYDDMTDYVDLLQHEEDLADGELYVVTYFEFDEYYCGLLQKVDFGITKQEIVQNVLNQKYREGANYFTMGQIFYETKMMIEHQ